jgi:hypothetical protein
MLVELNLQNVRQHIGKLTPEYLAVGANVICT